MLTNRRSPDIFASRREFIALLRAALCWGVPSTSLLLLKLVAYQIFRDEQLPQFTFQSYEILKDVLIQSLKKGLDSFPHCGAQRRVGRAPAVTRRIFAFDDREAWFEFADDFPAAI